MTAFTEKDAAEKWCPHVRAAIVTEVAGLFAGNVDIGGSRIMCIGSRCMQWRWHDSEVAYYMPSVNVPDKISRDEAERIIMGDKNVTALMSVGYQPSEMGVCPPLLSSTGMWSLTLSKPRGEDRRGYCGLAGKPDDGRR